MIYYWHALGNRFLTSLSNMCTNLNLTDAATCYKVVKSSILKSIPIRSKGFAVEMELTAKLAKRGCAIYEVPISYRGRTYAEGKKAGWWDGVKSLLTILKFKVLDDAYSEKWGESILHRLEQTRRFNGWMFGRIRGWVGERVLETGSGIGNLTRFFVGRRSLWATDVDPHYIEVLRNRFGSRRNVRIERLDITRAEDFHFVEGACDTAICLNVLEHVDDDLAALKNIRRALAPGGRLVLLVPRGKWLYGSLDRVLEHRRRYSPAQIRELLARAGMKVVHTIAFNKVGVPAWFFNGRVIRRTRFGKYQLKIFDSLIWLWRLVDCLPGLPGLSIIAVAEREDPPGGAA